MNVLVVDDHQIVITGVELILKNSLPFIAIEGMLTGEHLFSKLKKKDYSLVILDINIPNVDIYNVIYQLKQTHPSIKILIFSMNPEELFAKRYLKLGADGYLMKSANGDELVVAVEKIINGGRYLSQKLLARISEDALNGKSNNVLDDLSPREFEILKFLLQGYSIKEISSYTNLHHSTVSTHKSKIFEKTGVKNILELIEIANQYK